MKKIFIHTMLLMLPVFSAQAGTDARPKFSHKLHVANGVKPNCTACHPSTSSGQISWPTKDHKPCSSPLCHVSEFTEKRNSKLCLVCHTSSTPTSPNPVRKQFSQPSEFRGKFAHGSHLKLPPFKKRGECIQCHQKQYGEKVKQRKVLAAEHALCSSCHEATNRPAMTECASCHLLRGQPGSGTSEYSVSEKYTHSTHRKDIRTANKLSDAGQGWAKYDKSTAKELKCAVCHADVMTEATQIKPPQHRECEQCHNGNYSFNVTSTCYQCHGPTK